MANLSHLKEIYNDTIIYYIGVIFNLYGKHLQTKLLSVWMELV